MFNSCSLPLLVLCLAPVTALLQVTTGLTSVRIGDDQLAIMDIFAGNALLPVLFLLATLLSGRDVLLHAQDTNIDQSALGAMRTKVFHDRRVFRPRRGVAGMALDALVVLVLRLLSGCAWSPSHGVGNGSARGVTPRLC
ncbi:MAG: hypothetical protein M3Q03_01855 [Chloroflexota bacterium]|nr:hypothetical protein [Chloroflexota bacterium]